jgi:hypothetical protein
MDGGRSFKPDKGGEWDIGQLGKVVPLPLGLVELVLSHQTKP